MPDRLALSVTETAESLGCSRDAVYGLIYSGDLFSVRVGRRRLIPVASIETLLSPVGPGATTPPDTGTSVLASTSNHPNQGGRRGQR